jgi:hypothetical protein
MISRKGFSIWCLGKTNVRVAAKLNCPNEEFFLSDSFLFHSSPVLGSGYETGRSKWLNEMLVEC